MKIQIREGVFETNSSSTHSMTMCSSSQYQKWIDNEVLFDPWNEEFTDYDKAMEDVLANEYVSDEKKEVLREGDDINEIGEILSDNGYDTYNVYMENCDYEIFGNSYKTEGGEEVIAFGRFSLM